MLSVSSLHQGGRLLLLTLLLAAIFIQGCGNRNAAQSTEPGTTTQSAGSPVAHVGDVAPDFTLQALDGRTLSLSQFKGKIVLVYFWASWCPYCRERLPSTEAIWSDFRSSDFVLLTVNWGEERQTVADFAKANSFDFTVLLDPTKAASEKYGMFRYYALPTGFFVDRDGVIRATTRDTSPGMDETAIRQKISSMLAGS